MLSRITIENLDGQATRRPGGEGGGLRRGGRRVVRDRAAGSAPVAVVDAGCRRTGTSTTHPMPATRFPLGVVAVAPSDGLAAILARHRDAASASTAPSGSCGAARAPTRPPASCSRRSEATQADELLILPNNPNVVLAARQVASMTDRPIHVVPTRNCAEGVAALFELDHARAAEQNAGRMTEAGRGIQTMQVTEAVRDATVSGHKVKKGQMIVLDPDDGLLAVDNDAERAVLAALGRLEPGLLPDHDLLR